MKAVFGVYVIVPSPLSTAVPLCGSVIDAIVNGMSVSVSLAITSMITGISNSVVIESSIAIGGRLEMVLTSHRVA